MPPRRSNRSLTVAASGGSNPTNADDGEATIPINGADITPTNATKKKKQQTASTTKKTNNSLPHKKEVDSDSGAAANEIATKKRKVAKDKELATALPATAAEEQHTDNDATTIPADSTDELLLPRTETRKKAKPAPAHQQWTERTPLAKLWDAREHAAQSTTGSYTFTILSWNVAGLRALIKNHPDTLRNLAQRFNVDVLSLQETKLQEGHMDDAKLKLREYLDEHLGGEYDGYFSYSIVKKGYSGTAMFIKRRSKSIDAVVEEDGGDNGGSGGTKKKKQATLGAFFAPTKKKEGDEETPENGDDKSSSSSIGNDIPLSYLRPIKVETTLGLPAHDGEGRTITAEFPLFHLTNVYVPNSGQQLDRLAYRTQQWDTDFLAKMQRLEKDTKKPILWFGDLNVAHNEKDTWNEGAKHLAKSAGTTAEERASFARQLEAGYVDAFRHLHPEGRGHYTYWSQRAGNRAPNKGLRLDYFICSKELLEDTNGDDGNGNRKVRVRDCFMLPEIMGSDHCPIVLEMEIKK